MSDLRSKFENVREIKETMIRYGISFENGLYNSPFSHINEWMNGAWWIFQKQQDKIDAMKYLVCDLWIEMDDRNSKEYIIERCEPIIQDLLNN